MRVRESRRSLPLLLPLALLLAGLGAACGEAPSDATPPTEDASGDAAPPQGVGRSYERAFALLTPDTVAMVWLADARTVPGGVDRRHRGWTYEAGAWAQLTDVMWQSPPSRVPWRIVPHPPVRLIVGDGEVMDRLIVQGPDRAASAQFGDGLIQWPGPRGETVRVGEALLAASGSDGAAVERPALVVDLARAWAAETQPPGDWAFLVSGDSLQMVLAHATEATRVARAWVRWTFRDLQWPEVSVDWTDVRAFEPARRDVPVEWRLTTPGGDLRGLLRTRSSNLETGAGEGPVLPVEGFMLLEGTIEIEGQSVPVLGVIRHQQRS